eukprot:3233950-Pyramimonas_sp.AAC.1
MVDGYMVGLITDAIDLKALSHGSNEWSNVPFAARRAIEALAMHMLEHSSRLQVGDEYQLSIPYHILSTFAKTARGS